MELTKNRYELRPGVGVGLVELGAERTRILAQIGQPDDHRQDQTISFRDYYFNKNLLIDYNSAGRCESIEVENENVELLYKGTDLFAMSWPDLYRWLMIQDPTVHEEFSLVYISRILGLSTGPKFEKSKSTSSIFVFGRDYHWPTAAELQAEIGAEAAQKQSLPELMQSLGLDSFISDLEADL